jgi:hypothetical protein
MTALNAHLQALEDLVEHACRARIQPDELGDGFRDTMGKIGPLTSRSPEFQNADQNLTKEVLEYESSRSLAGISNIRRELARYCRAARG